ncbi:MAG TPA: VWA domain-containing protein [Candidatus Limnocylindrales bacterium]|nr:VWA domain-containing protein [Candidatus Limnocylindrales bacterium]
MRTVYAISLFALALFPAAGQDSEGTLTGQGLMERIRTRTTSAVAREQHPDIRVDVNMALVPVTVIDSYGRNVTGLVRENFRVLDNGKPLPIVAFGQQDQPITVGIVFDCSRSMTDKFATARQATHELFQQLNEQDESFLVTISDRPELRQPVTTDFNQVENALIFTHPQGTTSLLDGVYMALHEIKQAHTPRKAIVLVSDGGDNDSRYTLHELDRLAAESDTEIFSIGIFQNPRTTEEVNGPALLADLANHSGGVNFVVHDINDIRAAMTKIGVTLHNQYVLGLRPPDDVQAGKYRRIKVQLLVPTGVPPLTLFSRNGYYVPGR